MKVIVKLVQNVTKHWERSDGERNEQKKFCKVLMVRFTLLVDRLTLLIDRPLHCWVGPFTERLAHFLGRWASTSNLIGVDGPI